MNYEPLPTTTIIKVKRILEKVWAPFKDSLNIFKKGSIFEKVVVLLSLFGNGLGMLLKGLWERAFIGLVLLFIYLVYMFPSGFLHLTGATSLSYFPLWVVPLLASALLLVYWYFALCKTLEVVKKPKPSQGMVTTFIMKTQERFSKFAKVSGYTYRYGNNLNRFNLIIGYLVFFVPFLVRKQLIKGFSYMLVLGGYLFFMIVNGFGSIVSLINLGGFVGDRRQPLVYGITAIIATVFLIFLYIKAQKDNLNNENRVVNNEKILTFKQEYMDLKYDKAYLIMLFIPILGAVAFTIIPLIFMISLAFTNYNIAKEIGIGSFVWTGLNSFKLLFDGATNFKALVNVFSWTMTWSFFATLTCYFGGMFLALLIAKKTVKWKKLWRSLFVITIAVPQFVSLRVMYAMFHDYGPINSIITSLGLTRVTFWSNVNSAKTLIILINMWVGIPYFMLIMSGLLLNIPKDNYEAAEIDGASKVYIFRKITFPYLLFATTPLLITKFVDNINNFNVIWLLTGGGPMGQGTGGVAGGTDIFITWLYKLTMYNLNVAEYNIGAAIGIIMFIISAVLSLVIFRRTSSYKKEEEFRK